MKLTGERGEPIWIRSEDLRCACTTISDAPWILVWTSGCGVDDSLENPWKIPNTDANRAALNEAFAAADRRHHVASMPAMQAPIS